MIQLTTKPSGDATCRAAIAILRRATSVRSSAGRSPDRETLGVVLTGVLLDTVRASSEADSQCVTGTDRPESCTEVDKERRHGERNNASLTGPASHNKGRTTIASSSSARVSPKWQES